MRRHSIRYLLLLIVAGAALGGPALAQPQPIRMQISAGYEGANRFGEWFPVVIDIANDGPDVSGVLEWSFPGRNDERAFQRAVDLPRGSRKRVALEVFSYNAARVGRVRLLDQGAELARQDVPLDAVDTDRFLIGVVSDDPALLNSLAALRILGANSVTVRHIDVGTLPEHAMSLRGLNALFLHGLDADALTPAQREALALWVQLGGQLVVSGGIDGQRAVAGLLDLLPVEQVGGLVQGDLSPLASLGGQPAPAAAPVNQVRARPDAEQFPANAPLLFQRQHGSGTVTFSAFDLASLRGWGGEPQLWERLLDPITVMDPGMGMRRSGLDLLQSTLQLPSLNLPSAMTLFCFLMAYIVVIGPLNYLVLRRLGRLEWAWLTLPVTVLLFAGGLYVVGVALRGGQWQLHQVTVVQAVEGQRRGLATAFVGLFSPVRSSYTLAFPGGALVSESNRWNGSTSSDATLISSDTGVEVRDALVDVSSVRTFLAETALDLPVAIQSAHTGGSPVQIDLRNTGQVGLEDAMIVVGDAFQQVGTLAPGASLSVTLDALQPNFPWAVALPSVGALPSEELFNRSQMLSTLFNGDVFLQLIRRTDVVMQMPGVYLIGWVESPVVSVQVNGQASQPRGLTMYVVRLQESVSALAPELLPPTPEPTVLDTPTPEPAVLDTPTPDPAPTALPSATAAP